MKRLLLCALLFLVSAAFPQGAHAPMSYLLIYSVSVVTPGISTAMYCYPLVPDCNTVYHPEERHEWFATIEDGVSRMNQLSNGSTVSAVSAVTSGAFTSGTFTGGTFGFDHPLKIDTVIGLYEVHRLPVSYQKTGTQKVVINQPIEQEVPKMEWKLETPH